MKPPRTSGYKPHDVRKPGTAADKPAAGGWTPLTGSRIKNGPEGSGTPRSRMRSEDQRTDDDGPASPSPQPKSAKDDWKARSPRRKIREGRFGSDYRKVANDTEDETLHLIYGIHSVKEALRNPRRKFRRLLATENGALRLGEDGPLPIEPTIVKPDEIGRRLTPDAVHQGVLLEADPLAPLALGNIRRDGVVLALDQVTDPHNVGAILRSCAAFDVAALMITERHSPEVTGVLAKAASGALEHVSFAVVRNLSDGLEKLKALGFMCVGLDSEAGESLTDADFRKPLVIVLGAEGKGLRQKTRETCTMLARLDMPGNIRSLNVSNAAAIALYAITTATRARD